MAGNVGLLKHASNVPQCALAIESLPRRIRRGRLTLLIEPEQVEKVIVDPRVKAVTLTGSEKAGSTVASTAAREIKKSVLELGGSDAFIVMPSADFERALSTAVKARTINAGQSCIAAKRFMIADQIYDEFLNQFVDRMRALKVGDPMDEAIELGPLATEQILQGVHDQVQKSIAAGAKLLTGGNRIHGPGFPRPTMPGIAHYRERDIRPGHHFSACDADDMINVATTPVRLTASAWTGDPREQAVRLTWNMVFINAMVASVRACHSLWCEAFRFGARTRHFQRF